MSKACAAWVVVFCLVAAQAAACRPELPMPDPAGEEGGDDHGPFFTIEPDGKAGSSVPSVLRIHVTGAAVVGLEPADVVFCEGGLTAQNLQDLALGAPTLALQDRILPATVFAEEGELIVVPHHALAPLQRFSVGIGRLG